ncbi:NAD(P)-dependent oxidoreductase, partial [Candidatus Aerophobetes bacterium]|nr:NAD(P)-dependent oxidoreductase [Candidatus Aerophobetes bacterium]
DKAEIVPRLSFVDCIVEATGVPRVGAEVAFETIRNKKHVVMMNLEADVTAGFILSEFAKNAGVVYTVGAGDEPAAIKELYDFAVSVGFKVVAAGKGKNNPLNREATPRTLKEVAFKKGMNPKMLCEFVDGSKTMIEMSCVANATGLFPDVRGMHGPFCKLDELPKVFSLKEKGGILTREGVVDYALGKIAPGVFVVVTTDNPRIKKDLDYLGMGKGPSYLLYRPYHLTNMEIPVSIARAVIYREPTIAPLLEGPVAETITVAKRDLKKGKVIDGIGGFDVYGLIEKAYIAKEENLLPLGLAEGAVLKRDVKKGECIRWDDVYIEENVLLNLRKLQDRLFPPRRG